jgi:large subunit ribosomal protein L22
VNLIRGLPAGEAMMVLRFSPQSVSGQINKVLASAVANAANNQGVDPRNLVVSEVFVDEGPTMKRFRPRAQGRGYRIDKRTCHITVVVEPENEVSARPSIPKKRRAVAPVVKPAKAAPAAKATPAAKAAKVAPAADTAPAKKAAAKKAPAAKKAAPAKKAAAKKSTSPKAASPTKPVKADKKAGDE